MEIAKLTSETLPLFLALLPPDEQELLKNDESVFAMGAGTDGQARGVLVFYSDEERNEILYIAVSPSCRRRGVATALIKYLCEAVSETTASLICTFAAEDYSSPLCRLFLNCEGFDVSESDDESFFCTVTFEELSDALPVGWVLPEGEWGATFYTLPVAMQQNFWSALVENNYGHAVALKQERKAMLDSLCLCACKDDRVRSALFFQDEESSLLLRFVYSENRAERSFAALLRHAQTHLEQAAPNAQSLKIAAVTEVTRKIVERLFPNYEQTAQLFEATWDRLNISTHKQAANVNDKMMKGGFDE